jgi:hypothetical protein
VLQKQGSNNFLTAVGRRAAAAQRHSLELNPTAIIFFRATTLRASSLIFAPLTLRSSLRQTGAVSLSPESGMAEAMPDEN